MKGAYTLVIDLDDDVSVKLRSLREIEFQKGTWIYVGSAMGSGSTSLENRLRRHFRTKKTIHWHIDYLLDTGATIRSAIWAESEQKVECKIAQNLERMDTIIPGPKGFGASDCNQTCVSHIFYSTTDYEIENKIFSLFREMKLDPKLSRVGNI